MESINAVTQTPAGDVMPGAGVRSIDRVGPPLNHLLSAILTMIDAGEINCTAVCSVPGSSKDLTALVVSGLEGLGYLECTVFGTYVRTALKPPQET
jgi:hypothetical protein